MPEPALGVLPDPPEPAVPAEEPPAAATRPAAAALGPLPAAPAPAAPAGLALPPLLAAVPGVLAGAAVPARAVLPLLAAVPVGVVDGAVVGRAGMPEPATGCAAVGRLPALPVAAGVVLWNPASVFSLEQAASAAAARISAQRALRIDMSYSYRRCTPKA